jgi:hypothetical protein
MRAGLPLVVLALAASGLSAMEPAAARSERRSASLSTALATPERNADATAWIVHETANFRICSRFRRADFAPIGIRLERLRAELYAKWLAQDTCQTWTPKCQVVLHPTTGSYLEELGSGAEQTGGASTIEWSGGCVVVRRIDVRATTPDWLSAALPHEITHVVLADRFPDQQLPRWADEGMAVLADSAEKRSLHLRDAQDALRRQNGFRLVELLALETYPASGRWDAFYGQSVSLVQYLVEQDSPARFIDFVESAVEIGYDAALRQTYQIDGVRALERQWTARLRHPHPETALSAL